jgi:hypothetical protein
MKKCDKLAEAKANGFIRYLTGRPCNKGHFCERLVSDRSCVECNRIKAQYKRDSMTVVEKYEHGLKYRYLQTNWLLTAQGCLSRKQTGITYYQNNKDKLAIYRKEYNLKTNNFHSKQWKKTHPEVRAADTAKRRAAKLQRTPLWLTPEHHKQIGQFYWEAVEVSKLVGEFYHVDHIVPLQGKTVSGLHVPWNLQILHAKENLSKGNNHG